MGVIDRSSAKRWTWLVLLIVTAGVAGCRPERRPPPPPRPTPEPVSTPAPTKARAKPIPRDITRLPLTRLIDSKTPEAAADALRLAEQARVRLDKGTTDEAIELCERAINESPRTVAPYVILARAYLAEGQVEQARDTLQKASALQPSAAWLAEVVALNGVILESGGNRDAAGAAYRRALEIFAGNQTAREALARMKKP
jgi:tetratricopeptide (TPR) repeat protein